MEIVENKNSVYISDVDFTLLASDKKLSPVTRKHVMEFYKRGINFTVATARSIYSLAPLLGNVKFNLPIIEFNGGYITEYDTKSPYHIFDIDSSTISQIRSIGLGFDLYPLISTYSDKQKFYPPSITNSAVNQYLEEKIKSGDPRMQTGDTPFDQIIQDQVLAMTYMGSETAIHRLHKELLRTVGDQVIMHYYENKYHPGTYWLTIHDEQSSKEYAIQQLLKDSDVNGAELVVFGDDVNDIGMMQLADRAIAVSNAKPSVKEVADEIIGSNDEDAVVKYIDNETK